MPGSQLRPRLGPRECKFGDRENSREGWLRSRNPDSSSLASGQRTVARPGSLRAACKASRLGEDSAVCCSRSCQGHLWELPIAILVLTCPEGPLGLHWGWVLARARSCWREGVPEALLLLSHSPNLLHPSLTAGGWTSGKSCKLRG